MAKETELLGAQIGQAVNHQIEAGMADRIKTKRPVKIDFLSASLKVISASLSEARRSTLMAAHLPINLPQLDLLTQVGSKAADILENPHSSSNRKSESRKIGRAITKQMLTFLGDLLEQQNIEATILPLLPTQNPAVDRFQLDRYGKLSWLAHQTETSLLALAAHQPQFFYQPTLDKLVHTFGQPMKDSLAKLWTHSEVPAQLKTKIIKAIHPAKSKPSLTRPLSPSPARRSYP